MKKLTTLVAIMAVFGFVASPAMAALIALGLNYTNSSNDLGAADQAGISGFTNWNNLYDQRGAPGNTQFRTAGELLLSDGTFDPTAKIDSWAAGDGNSWGDPPPAVVSTVYPGDTTLWAIGSRDYSPSAAGQTITLSGLSTTFANGFSVITYQDYLVGPVSAGNVTVTATGGPYSAGWSLVNTSGFNADFGSFGHTVNIPIPAGVDLVSINFHPTSGAAFAQATLLGIQIVGEVEGGELVPEPAGLGLIGLALLAVRRRRS